MPVKDGDRLELIDQVLGEVNVVQSTDDWPLILALKTRPSHETLHPSLSTV